MRMFSVLPVLLSLCFISGAMAADTSAKEPSAAQLAQREKMTNCNKAAADKNLKGDERKTFMSTCLKAGSTIDEKKVTPQQQKMADCNKEAGTKNLKGDDRKTFMSTCLTSKPATTEKAAAAATTGAAVATATPQQQKMADCNKEAGTKNLKGEDRKTFMSTCLTGKPAANEKAVTPQQQKMAECNKEAGDKALKGNDRKTFMDTCLKKAA
ncbi:psiF repeat-containing protein [Pragia fontium DSM 5563 = ATCC 49100]|uniref:PsiF repeat-containing protein n=2 Tax=Pragia fontium TaxID=82985 RepID=A0AAJ4WCJ1_9GAMM|nr:psiF repeat-containing protein [Pragia fontium DSM 5563 = ATCC 49100]